MKVITMIKKLFVRCTLIKINIQVMSILCIYNIFKFLWELRYSYVLHDANTTDLYVHLNNRFYEMVLFVLFILLSLRNHVTPFSSRIAELTIVLVLCVLLELYNMAV